MKPTKYRAKKVTAPCGRGFASKREYFRWCALVDSAMLGNIRDLTIQPKFLIQAGFRTADGKAERAIHYIADFQYIETATGLTVVEDVKGFATEAYKLKRKLFLFKFPNIKFKEIK